MIKTAQVKKREVDKEKLEIRKIHLMRHDIQKLAKEVAIEEARKQALTKFCVEKWILNIFFCSFGHTIQQILKRQKEAIAKQIRMTMVLTNFMKNLIRRFTKKGKTVQNRFIVDIRL